MHGLGTGMPVYQHPPSASGHLAGTVSVHVECYYDNYYGIVKYNFMQ